MNDRHEQLLSQIYCQAHVNLPKHGKSLPIAVRIYLGCFTNTLLQSFHHKWQIGDSHTLVFSNALHQSIEIGDIDFHVHSVMGYLRLAPEHAIGNNLAPTRELHALPGFDAGNLHRGFTHGWRGRCFLLLLRGPCRKVKYILFHDSSMGTTSRNYLRQVHPLQACKRLGSG